MFCLLSPARRLAVFFVLTIPTLLCASSHAAELPDGSAADRRVVVDAIAERLEGSYILAETAKQMADALRADLARGTYDGIDSLESLAQRLTDDLRAISHDGHLRIRYHADPAQVIPSWNTPGPDAQARYERHARRTNHGFVRVEILPGNIGYLRLDEFGDPALGGDTAAAVMRFVAHTDALIIDLRHNGGGGGMGAVLATYLLGTKPTHLSDFHIRERNETIQLRTLPHVTGPIYTRSVFLLTGPRTASAAESFVYMLKNRNRVQVIGQKTAGAANPGRFVRVSEHLAVFIPDGRPIDPLTGTNWERVGIAPDIEIDPKHALTHAHRLALEQLLASPNSEARDTDEWRNALTALKAVN